MNEMSLHHSLSDIATVWNKGKLLLFSHQMFNCYCVEYYIGYTVALFYKKKILVLLFIMN